MDSRNFLIKKYLHSQNAVRISFVGSSRRKQQTKSIRIMNIIEALSALQSNNIESVVHPTGSTAWDIDCLKEVINEAIAEDRLEETSDKGEWVVDADGITQLTEDGYRTANRYIAA